MSLSSEEAAQTLSQVERTARHSAVVHGYRQSAPHFFIWAAVWAVGYTATYVSPADAGQIWQIVTSIGLAASFLAGLRVRKDSGISRQNGWRLLGTVAVTQGFMTSVMLVIHGQGWEMAVLWPLLVGALYAAIGIWAGLRYAITGLALMALTLIGFFYLPQYFCLWMAGIGSGALLLGGIWLRAA